MIEFSKDSWHYRVITNDTTGVVGYMVPQSLCQYVRVLCWVMIAWVLIVAVMSGMISVLIISAIVPILYIMDYHELITNENVIISTIFGLIAWFMLAMGFAVHFFEKWLNHLSKESSCDDNEKEPSLIIEHFKSIHNKICPMIKFKE